MDGCLNLVKIRLADDITILAQLRVEAGNLFADCFPSFFSGEKLS